MIYSVIVPIYKVEKYLEKCITSILNQSFTDFELILVDDGSPDSCPQICDNFASKDSRVRVIHKKNGGLVSARNIGIQAVKGDYICYVDGDDWIHKDMLSEIYKASIQKYSPDMIIFGIVKLFADRKEEIFTDLDDGIYKKEQLIKDIYPYMMYDSRKPFCKGLIFPAACNKIYKRNLLLKHYCKDERIRMGEDNAFVYECVWNSESIYVKNKIYYFYNQLNPGAMNQSYDPYRFKNNNYLFKYMEKQLYGEDKDLDEQLNAFKAYWVTMAVFHEIKCGKGILEASRHIRLGIRDNKSLENIKLKGLPKSAKIFILMLRCHLYVTTIIASKIVQKNR